ncbi:DUF4293 domain-containing protein [Bacteroidota bacterium]
MIQRIQSLLLLSASIACFILIFMKFTVDIKNQDGETINHIEYSLVQYNIQTLNPEEEQSAMPVLPFVFAALISLISLFTIFLYKKRPMQVIFARFLILLSAGFIIALIFSLDQFGGLKEFVNASPINYLLIILPSLAIIFFFLAIKGINKDERLVREADRIR